MKPLFCLMLGALGLGVVCLRAHPSGDWPVREQETIEKTMPLSTAPMRLLVENIYGYVHVTTGTGPQVRVTARKTIRAESDSDLKAAKEEVRLAMSEKAGTASIEYEAPWICRNEHGSGGCGDGQRRFYTVMYDIDVQVPMGARPFVSTVNSGDIRVDGTTGDFEIKNVNGAVTLTGIAGSGQVSTVNGAITVRFLKSPQSATSFETVNGQVDVYFPADLSANLLFQTFNGEMFSDFDVTSVPIPQVSGERRGGKFIYHSNGLKGARVGRGGPEIKFNTLNGNIRMHRVGQAIAWNGASNNE